MLFFNAADNRYRDIKLEPQFSNCERRDDLSNVIRMNASQFKGNIQSWSGFNKIKDTPRGPQLLREYDEEIKKIFDEEDLNKIELNCHFSYFVVMGKKI